MKDLIKKILHEAVGVPEGIALSARKLYNDIILYLESNPEYATNEEQFELPDAGQYNFSNYKIWEVNVTISLLEATNIDKYVIVGMGIARSGERVGKFMKTRNQGSVNIDIRVAYPTGTPDSDEVITLLKSEKSKYISSLAHELKHGYDDYMNPLGDRVENLAPYQIFSNSRFGNKIVDTFIYDLYYTSMIESLVRPSEMYSLAMEENITKNDFIGFLKQNETFIILQRIANFSYQDFRNQLKQDMKFVNQVISNFKDEVMPSDDDGKIDLFLKGFYITLGNQTIDKFRDMISPQNPILALFALFGSGNTDLDEEDQKLFEKFQRKIRKYDGKEVEYFKNTLRENQYQAQQAIKKLGKVYSILPDSEIVENYQKIEIFDPMSFEMSQLMNKVRKITLSK